MTCDSCAQPTRATQCDHDRTLCDDCWPATCGTCKADSTYFVDGWRE